MSAETLLMMSHSVLLVEGFYGGSHKQLIDLLELEIEECIKVTLPAKKWHWRARTAALYFSEIVPQHHKFKVLFCSSVLNLAELVALRPDLAKIKKVLYFHENQLEYPVRKHQDRDFQYGYNQILSCLVADDVLFNSYYNLESFLGNINSHLKLIPDHRPKGITEKIQPKCRVLHFPINFDGIMCVCSDDTQKRTAQFNTKTVVKFAKIEKDNSSAEGALTTGDNRSKMCEPNELQRDSGPSFLHDLKREGEHNTDETARTVSPNNSRIENVGFELCRSACESLTSNSKDSKHAPCAGMNKPQVCPVQGQEELERSKEVKKCDAKDETRLSADEIRVNSLHIVWPHRWEHDKDPDTFFHVLFRLHDEGYSFFVSVLGETYTDVPDIFGDAKKRLGEHVLHWGYIPSRQQYYETLFEADVVVSTAKHEFFGVAMIEAAYLGCYPLCPNRIVYPEIFPRECLYNTENQLYKRLRDFCKFPQALRARRLDVNLERFSWSSLKDKYRDLLS